MSAQIEKVLVNAGVKLSRLDMDKQQIAHSSVLRYVFRVISSGELSKELKEVHEDFTPKAVRICLLRNGRIQKNIKLFAYAAVKTPNVPPEIFGVGAKDTKIVLQRLEEDALLFKTLRNYQKKGYCILTPSKMDRLVTDVIEEIKTHTAKFVFRKHDFILKSEGEDSHSIRQELYWWATYAIYKAYPRIDSFLHAVNIAKQAVHNRGINLIKEHTAQSRQRLIRNDDGTFSSRQVPMHAMLTTTGSGEEIDQFNHLVVDRTGKSADGKSIQDMHDREDLRIALRAMNRILPDRMKLLLKLWAGMHDQAFSVWLGRQNDEWFDEVKDMNGRKMYLLKCVDFSGIRRDVAFKFFRSLQYKFIDYAPVAVAKTLRQASMVGA